MIIPLWELIHEKLLSKALRTSLKPHLLKVPEASRPKVLLASPLKQALQKILTPVLTALLPLTQILPTVNKKPKAKKNDACRKSRVFSMALGTAWHVFKANKWWLKLRCRSCLHSHQCLSSSSYHQREVKHLWWHWETNI